MTRHFTAADINAAITMPALIAAVRRELIAAQVGEFDQPPRLVLGSGSLLIMAALHRASGDASVKSVTVRDGESGKSVQGTLLWISQESGLPLFSADGARVTSLRTGAAAGVATDLLARSDASTFAVLGSGAQAETQVRAICSVRDITELRVFSRTPAHAERFSDRIRLLLPAIDVQVAKSCDEAVDGADVISCATSATEPLFAADTVSRDAHINAIGSYLPHMSEIAPRLLLDAATIVVDNLEGCLAESGEIRSALEQGLSKDKLQPLGFALTSPQDRNALTIYKSVGCAVLDWALGSVLAQRT